MAVVKPVVSITKPKRSKGPKTPPGYTGQAGSAPPPTSSRPTGTRPGGTRAPVAVSRIPPPAAALPPPPPAPFAPTSAWWMSQFAADPRYMTTAPLLDEQRSGIGRSYGFTLARDAQGRPLYRTAAGAAGITQQFDDKGAIVYKDAEGNVYKPSELQLDIQRVARGQAGYLSGQFGAAEAGSEARRYGIGDVSAQSGIRRSGMQQSVEQQEFNALQSALAGLTSRAGAELAGVDERFAELYREIYGDLAKRAEELAAPATPPATETPAAPGASADGVVPPPAPVNTNPVTETGLVPGQALSAGPNGQFMGQASAIVGQRDAPYESKVASLNALKRFALTPQQLRWIAEWIENNKPKPKPAQGKGK